MEKSDPPSSLRVGFGRSPLPTAPSSPSEADAVEEQQPLSDAAQGQGKGLARDAGPDHTGVPLYPTPPTSSSSSSTRRASEAGSEEGSKPRESVPANACCPILARRQSRRVVMPLRTRRQTGGLSTLSNITTSSAVHAAHISNPATSRTSTRPSTPTSDPSARNALSWLSSHLELAKLTNDVASPRKKSTPPLTPRALSNDGSELAKQSQRATDIPNGKASNTGPGQANPHSSPPVSPPKGKLSVIVSQARGLRPSFNPYAVTVFEWIESVARPSKAGQVEIEPEFRGGEQTVGGVPIKRSGSDMGRSMAIPMKSRQSSTTSLSEQKDFRNGRYITDPRWDHVALLY